MPSGRTVSIALLLTGLVVLAPIVDDAAAGKGSKGKRRGKVVRVERSRLAGGGYPRLCQVRGDGSASCYGRAVETGEVGAVIDSTGVRAQLRIAQVTPTLDSCGNVTSWEITTELERGDLSNLGYGFLVIDWKASTRAKMYSDPNLIVPGGRAGESVWASFDDDDDAQVDLVVTAFSCDASGAPAGSGGYCMGYYGRDGGGFIEIRLDIVRSCY